MVHVSPSCLISVSLWVLPLAPHRGCTHLTGCSCTVWKDLAAKGWSPAAWGVGWGRGSGGSCAAQHSSRRFLLGDGPWISERWFSQRRGLQTYPQRIVLRTLLRQTAAAKWQLKIWIVGIFKTVFLVCIHSNIVVVVFTYGENNINNSVKTQFTISKIIIHKCKCQRFYSSCSLTLS